jgi:hypothetical protein
MGNKKNVALRADSLRIIKEFSKKNDNAIRAEENKTATHAMAFLTFSKPGALGVLGVLGILGVLGAFGSLGVLGVDDEPVLLESLEERPRVSEVKRGRRGL